MSNDQIDTRAILEAHFERTRERFAGERVVLCIQDTTFVDYSNRPATTGLGVLQDEKHFGFLCHTTLAVRPDRVPLGLFDQEYLVRDPAEFGKKHLRKSKPIEEKESNKWLGSLQATAEAMQRFPETTFVHVADREADIFDLLQRARDLGVWVLVRGNWDRNTVQGKLWKQVEETSVVGTMEVEVPQQTKRPARKAQLEIRYCPLDIEPPKSRSKEKLSPTPTWCVLAMEKGASLTNSGQASSDQTSSSAEKIVWLLHSTEPIESLDHACRCVEWYACRWTIEIFHRVLKGGCNIEEREFRDVTRLQRYLAIDSVVAYRILYLTLVGRAHPEWDCSLVFSPHEWKGLFAYIHRTQKPPAKPPSLEQAIEWIARLGGYLVTRKKKPPGVEVLWTGLLRLADIAEMWRVFNPEANPKYCG